MTIEHTPDSYPAPKAPVLPVLSWNSLSAGQSWQGPSILDANNRLPVTSGRAAITLALRRLGIKNGDTVLLPSFHCGSMVEPVVAVGGTTVFYNIKPDLSYDCDDIASKITATSKAILVVHYFGFPQNLDDISRLCKQQKISLIEDCAHAYFGSVQGKSMGCSGDLAIASIRKFFPVTEGGYLLSENHNLDRIELYSSGAKYNLKKCLDIFEEAVGYDRLSGINWLIKLPLALKRLILKSVKFDTANQETSLDSQSVPKRFVFLDQQRIDKKMGTVTECIVGKTNLQRVVEKRREHYQRLADELGKLDGGRPLFPELPEEVVPYKFPFILDHQETIFPVLKNQGVPIYRWEEIENTSCPVSLSYSSNLLQLPCHQELTPNELTWIIQTIRTALSDGSRKTASG